MQFEEFVEDRVFSPTLVADALHTTQAEIAGTLGLGRDAFSCASQIPSAEDADATAADVGDPPPS